MQAIEQINECIKSAMDSRPDLFIVSSHVSNGLDINLIIDGDELVNITDCIELSRAIEHNLDREEMDFSIKVQSPGASEPLLFPRQYNKHLGRTLKIKTIDEKLEGKLAKVNGESIVLVWKSREKKPVGKGKITVTHEKEISFKDIEQSKIKLTFNTK